MSKISYFNSSGGIYLSEAYGSGLASSCSKGGKLVHDFDDIFVGVLRSSERTSVMVPFMKLYGWAEISTCIILASGRYDGAGLE